MSGYNVAIVFSHQDPAGVGVAEALVGLTAASVCRLERARSCWLLEEFNVILAGFDEDDIYFDFLDDVFGGRVDGYIVLSRHSGGKPSLTVHHPGNPGPEAPYGGKPRSLPPAWPRLAAHLLRTYRRVAVERGLTSEFQVTLEATHHGPTELGRPIVFIEIGSSEREWVRRDAHEAMAETVLQVLREGPGGVECRRVVIGVGDTHYPAKHTRNVLERGYCYGHIFSKHVLQHLDEDILAKAVQKSVDKIEAIVMAKVPSQVKKLVIAFAEKRGLQVEK